MIEPVGVHKGRAQIERPTTTDTIGHRKVEQVNLVFLLGILSDPLRLLHVADEVPEGILPAVTELNGPLPRRRSARKEPVKARGSSRSGLDPAA